MHLYLCVIISSKLTIYHLSYVIFLSSTYLFLSFIYLSTTFLPFSLYVHKFIQGRRGGTIKIEQFLKYEW